jgi:hypothetical protein
MRALQRIGISGFAFLLCFPAAGAQVSVTASGSFGTLERLTDSSQIGLPYTAEYKTSTVQKLADGTTITHAGTYLTARDSAGRFRQEHLLGGGLGGGEVSNAPKAISIKDPVAHTLLNWNTSMQKVHVMHLPNMEELKARLPASQKSRTVTVLGSAIAPGSTPIHERKSEEQADGPTFRRESLGSNTIHGVVAEGERITTTLPTGAIGNDRPLVSTREVWRSVDLKLTVLEIQNDPRNGVTTTELVNLDRSEPDPALFRAPDGYEVDDPNR